MAREVSDGRKEQLHPEWESGESTVSALCESFGISRTLAYRYIGRYLKEASGAWTSRVSSAWATCGTATR